MKLTRVYWHRLVQEFIHNLRLSRTSVGVTTASFLTRLWCVQPKGEVAFQHCFHTSRTAFRVSKRLTSIFGILLLIHTCVFTRLYVCRSPDSDIYIMYHILETRYEQHSTEGNPKYVIELYLVSIANMVTERNFEVCTSYIRSVMLNFICW